MTTTIKQTTITKDASNKKLVVVREFDAPLPLVWQAWTDSSLLDQWWAPRPWKAETKKMDFREGGSWLYAMKGPEGEIHWCRMDFDKIVPQKSFAGTNGFADEQGNRTHDIPSMYWHAQFAGTGDRTTVTVEITFESEQALKTIVEMGFQEGFTAAHGNLDEVLADRK